MKKKEIEKASLENKFYQRSLEYIARRPRSVLEIKQYLYKKEAPDSVFEPVIQKLEKKGYLDDKKFAEWFVEGRINSLKLKGPRKIRQELAKKGIHSSIINQVFKKLNISEALDSKNAKIEEFIEKERVKLQKKYDDEYIIKQKIMQKLARKGFSYDRIKDLV